MTNPLGGAWRWLFLLAGLALATAAPAQTDKRSLPGAVPPTTIYCPDAAGVPQVCEFNPHDLTALNAGTAYAWSTGAVAVSSGNYLNVVIANPAGSGRTLCLVTREFNSSAAAVLLYQPFLDPNPLTGATTRTGNNRLVGGGGPAAAAVFTYAMQGAAIATGTSGPSDFIPAGGNPSSIPFLTGITPGHSIGFSVGGAGGGLAATASVLVTISGYERAGIGC